MDTPDVPANVYFDISGWQEIARNRMELLTENLSSLLGAFPGRVCFGTDSPFFSYNLAAQEKWWLASVKAFLRQSFQTISERRGRRFYAALRLFGRRAIQCGSLAEGKPLHMSQMSRNEVANAIVAFLRKETNFDDLALINESTRLLELGIIDSLMMMSVATYCDESFGCHIRPDDLTRREPGKRSSPGGPGATFQIVGRRRAMIKSYEVRF